MNRPVKTTTNKEDLMDKTVVITGASSGAGRAAAIEFARHGAKLVLASRNIEALDEVEAECREIGALALAVKTDVTNAEAMKKLAATAAEFGGTIDIWINNAGVLAAGEFTETPIEVHEQVIRINLIGYLNGAHAVLPYFKKQQQGILINNISVGGWLPVPYSVAYSASKFGLRGYSEALRGELNRFPGIHVCDLFPAFLDSPGMQHSANYTGHILRPAPPVYDPQRLAVAMVSLAKRPRKSVTVGAAASMLRLSHAFFPSFTRYLTAKSVEGYLKKAEPAPTTSGNLFAASDYGTSIHGGWNSDADYDSRKKKAINVLVITGIAAGLFLLGRSKFVEKKK
ncbi:MAG: short-chain dehydrogenase [Segetibacter sp.]|jgi:short-subunit dehydrogenase|nr:short-chain dehydrogenase [Segetibacter sp.]